MNEVICINTSLLKGRVRPEFEKQVERLGEEGILAPYEERVKTRELPLMTIVQ